MRAAGWAAAGVFTYDAQEGTPAAAMPDQVPAALAFARAAALGEAIDDEASRFWEGLAGDPLSVLVERGTSSPEGVAVGRNALQAPDIDGRTLVRGARCRRGDLVHAVAVEAVGYDVEAVAEPLPP